MGTFIVITIILHFIQVAVTVIFLSTGDGDAMGIETKMQAVLWLLAPYYWLYSLGKSTLRGINELDD